MGKKNQGFTLVELIISIALISIVVMFLFNLLVDVRYSSKNIDFNRKNQQTRAVIIKNVQNDFLDETKGGIVEIVDESSSSSHELEIMFKFKNDSSTTLRAGNDGNNDYVSYIYDNGTEEKWYIDKQNSSTYLGVHCVKYSSTLGIVEINPELSTKLDNEYFSMKITIPVVVKKDSPNFIDDLEFYYIGLKSDGMNIPDVHTQYLGNYDEDTCG